MRTPFLEALVPRSSAPHAAATWAQALRRLYDAVPATIVAPCVRAKAAPRTFGSITQTFAAWGALRGCRLVPSDLTSWFGRGFGWRNLFQMRSFFPAYADKLQTASAVSEAREHR